MIVHRVLSHPRAPSIRTFADQRTRRALSDGRVESLPGRYSWLVKLPTTARVPRPVQCLLTLMNLALAVAAGARIALGTASAKAIVSVVDSGFSTVAGVVASSLARKPHVLWVFDPWEENAYPLPDRWLGRLLEGRIMRRAAAVVVFSDELARHYRAKHGVQARVLHIPITGPSHATEVHKRPPARVAQVLSAGSLYWAQYDALERIAAACDRIRDAELVVMAGNQAPALPGARMVASVPVSEFRDRLAAADLLVLGLSFDSPYPIVIETATPARFPESLASGTPVLVHAPAGSYLARVTRDAEAGIVVDSPDVDALEAAIRSVLADPDGTRKMVERAQELSRSFDHERVVGEFTSILDSAR